jgi:nitric oxide reductase large subunit
MNATNETSKQGRINWLNVLTVCSAAILIGAEVFGAAFAAGWAFSNLFQLGEYGTHGLQALFFVLGIFVMIRFVLNARRIEPFTRS